MAETTNNNIANPLLSNLEAKDIANLDLNTDNFDTSSFWKSRDETQQHSIQQKIFEISRFGPYSELKEILDRELPVSIPITSDDGPTSLSSSSSTQQVVSLTSQEPYRLNLDILDSSGWSPLIHASFNGHYEIVKEIIDYQEKKLKYQYKDERMNDNENELKYKHYFKLFICRSVNWNGSTALHLSCARGHELIVKLLLNKMLFNQYKIDNKLSINTLDFDSATPLHCAVLGKHYNIVQMLLLNNAVTNQKDIRGKTAFDWAKERNMIKYIALFNKYINKNDKIQDPVIEDNDIPAKVVESIWEDQERKSMEPHNNSNLNLLDTISQPQSSPSPENINQCQVPSQSPGPATNNGWYQGPHPNHMNNNNNGNWNNNWNQNQNQNQGGWNRGIPDQRQRAPRHIRYEQQHRNQQQYAQTPGPYGNYQNGPRHFNFPPHGPHNNGNNNDWNQQQNNWNGNCNNNGYNPRWNNNCNNRWNNNNNNRWNSNGNGNNIGPRWNNNGNNNWQQQQQQPMTRHQSVSPQLSTNNVTIPLPPLSISKSWDCYNAQQSDTNTNINAVPSKVTMQASKSHDEQQKDDNKCQETDAVKIRDKILSATAANKKVSGDAIMIEQKQLESVPIDGDEIKLDEHDKDGTGDLNENDYDKNNKDSTINIKNDNNALKFRNKYLSARCETLEKENESLIKNMKLEKDKNNELSKQFDIKQKQIHELRHTMRKMRKFLDSLPIKLRRNFYKDNGNFNIEKTESDDSEKDDKEKVNDKENEAIKHTSKGWKTTNGNMNGNGNGYNKHKNQRNNNNKRLYRNNDRKYGRHNNQRKDHNSMDEGWRRKR